jgi:hypothetical protein
MFDPANGPPQIPSKCVTCDIDAPNGEVVLLDDIFYRVHPGVCLAKFYLTKPELMKRNDLTVEFLEELIARQQ